MKVRNSSKKTIVIMLICLLFSSVFLQFGFSKNVSAEVNYAQSVYFSTKDGVITQADNNQYGENQGIGLKIVPKPQINSVTINYNNYIFTKNGGYLDDFLKLQVIPSAESITGMTASVSDKSSLDFLSMFVILEDSENPNQQLVMTVDAANRIGDTAGTTSRVCFTDNITYDPSKYGDVSQPAIGYERVSAEKYQRQGTTVRLGGQSLRGTTLGYTGFFSCTDVQETTHPLTFAYKSFNNRPTVQVGEYDLVAYLDNNSPPKVGQQGFLDAAVANFPSNFQYADRYTDAYVADLFSSGKVKMSIKLNNIQSDEINLNILDIASQKISLFSSSKGSLLSEKKQDGSYILSINGASKNANDGTTIKYNGLLDAAETNNYRFLGDYLKLQVIPSDESITRITSNINDRNSLDFLSMFVVLEDSVNPNQQLVMTVDAAKRIKSTEGTVSRVSFTDDIAYDSSKPGDISALALGYDHAEQYNYHKNGYLVRLNNKNLSNHVDGLGYTGFFAHKEGENTYPLTFSYFANAETNYLNRPTVQVGEIADTDKFTALLDDLSPSPTNANKTSYLATTRTKLQEDLPDSPYFDRYTDDYVKNLFSSGKVKMSIRLNNIQRDTVKIKIIEIGGQPVSEEGIGLKDNAAPKITFKGDNTSINYLQNVSYDLEKLIDVADVDSNITYTATATVNQSIHNISDINNVIFDFFGQAQINIVATDSAGNNSDTFNFNINIVEDNALPNECRIEIRRNDSTFIVPNLPNYGLDSYYVKLYYADDVGFANEITTGYRYKFTQIGEYMLVYYISYATSNDPYITKIVRTIVEDTTPPDITVSGEYEKEYNVGHSIQILDAEVVDNFDADLTYMVKAYHGNNEVEITNNMLYMNQLGKYTVKYSSIDSSGNAQELSISFDSIDNEKPDISLMSSYEEKYSLNSKINIIGLNIKDNYSLAENVQLIVKVVYEDNEILVTDNTFVAEKLGEYYIIYQATDEANNTQYLVESITVDYGNKSNKTAIIIAISVSAGALLIGAGIAFIIIKKRKGKNNA